MMLFHPSSVGNLMGDAKSIDPALLDADLAALCKKKVKTPEDHAILAPLLEQTLSAGAKTFLGKLAKEYVYDFRERVTTKYMDKGLAVEDASIDLYNRVFFTRHKKNTERRKNEWLTGEVDIDAGNKIIDIKSAWSLATFPAISQDAHDSLYEWQGRCYLMLWDRPEFEIAYCMVNTPEELIRYEQRELHIVDHIDPELRVTCIRYQRDDALENRIRVKCTAAQKYLHELVERICARA